MRKLIETYYRIMKHDSEGRLVRDTGLMPSHSYVIQFLELIQGFFDGLNVVATDVDGAENLIIEQSVRVEYVGTVDALVGDDTHGIVVGTNAGTSAEDNEDYSLDTKIAEGAGGGQLSYQAVTIVDAREVGPNVDLDVSRVFQNDSGGTITVKEIGVIVKNTTDTKYHLILRDVVADEPVDDAEALTVVYVLRTTV